MTKKSTPSWVSYNPRAAARAAGYKTGGIPKKALVRKAPVVQHKIPPTKVKTSHTPYAGYGGYYATPAQASASIQAGRPRMVTLPPKVKMQKEVYNIPIVVGGAPPSLKNIAYHKKQAEKQNLEVRFTTDPKTGRTTSSGYRDYTPRRRPIGPRIRRKKWRRKLTGL